MPRFPVCHNGQLLPPDPRVLPSPHPPATPQPSQSLLAARGKLEVPPQMKAAMQKTYNESQVRQLAACMQPSSALVLA